MVSRRELIAVVVVAVGCKEPAQAPPQPRPVPVVVDAAIDAPPDAAPDAAIDAAVDAGIDAMDPEMAKVMASPPCCCALASDPPEYETAPRLLCQQDMHGRCVAAAKCPKPGSVEAQIATWWKAASNGDARAHTAAAFVIEAFVPPDVFRGATCGNPYVNDAALPGDECLRLAVVNHRPQALRAGWGCKGFSGTVLAKNLRAERVAAKDRLRCGTRRGASVFVAVDTSGKVTAFLVNSR